MTTTTKIKFTEARGQLALKNLPALPPCNPGLSALTMSFPVPDGETILGTPFKPANCYFLEKRGVSPKE